MLYTMNKKGFGDCVSDIPNLFILADIQIMTLLKNVFIFSQLISVARLEKQMPAMDGIEALRASVNKTLSFRA